jgi:hypothetical protein
MIARGLGLARGGWIEEPLDQGVTEAELILRRPWLPPEPPPTSRGISPLLREESYRDIARGTKRHPTHDARKRGNDPRVWLKLRPLRS